MKKVLCLIFLSIEILFSIGGVVFIEPKIGIAPYERFESKAESENLNNFFDYGVDIYMPIPKFESFEIGMGAEIRRLHPLLSYRKNVGLFFTLIKLPTLLDTMIVVRSGFLQNRFLQRTFYYGVGIEKNIHKVIFQVLFDDMQIKNNNTNAHYQSVVFKIGVKI